MKKSIFIFVLSFFVFNGFCNAKPNDKSQKKVVVSTRLVKTLKMVSNISFERNIARLVACTRTGTAQVSGIGCVDISVTAATCELAAQGVADAKKKFEL